jgi:dihydrofolate synthase/folylpolyglutamate synthase
VEDNEVRTGGARDAAEAFLGRAFAGDADVRLPGRLEWRSDDEVWDGAHTPEAVDWLLERLPGDGWVIVASVLLDKDVDGMLERLVRVSSSFVATQSSNPRALPAPELSDRARRYVSDVVTIADPVAALRRAHELGPRVLVTGSLYLLADLHAAAPRCRL